MRYSGTIAEWKDEQGYGFITPNHGGAQVFVHINAFSNREQRPAGNERVTYELGQDGRGRIRAEKVALEGEHVLRASSPGDGAMPMAFAIVFVILVAVFTIVGHLPIFVPGIYLGASIVTYITYAMDKSAAKKGQWRTSENALHFLGLIGGWPGGLAAQRLLRHKSSKQSFQVTFWVTVFLNGAVLGWLLSPHGSSFLHAKFIDAMWLR